MELFGRIYGKVIMWLLLELHLNITFVYYVFWNFYIYLR